MRQRILATVLALVVLTSVVSVAGAASTVQDEQASVTMGAQTSGGHTVVVDEVTVPDGGFVTIHDASLEGGDALGSVVGTSGYLDPGTHENVTVRLDEPLSEDATLIAMPHRDTDGDRAYTFVSSNAGADGPYAADGGAVTDAAEVTVSATVEASDQPTDGASVVVDRVELSEGGFVTVHDASVTEGAVFESIRGTSEYLEAGVHENVRIELDDPVEGNATLVPMAHRDTNDNQAYDFADTEGEADGPFVDDAGGAVVDTTAVTLSDEASATFEAQSTGGNAVVVEAVFVPEGGFVTMHDSSLLEGETFDSVRGTSEYLEPGFHRDVRVHLDEPLESDDALIAMPHRDTNDNETYDFVDEEGGDDGPYTADGGAVVDDANVTVSASATIDHQRSDGVRVVVENVDLSEGGFVTIHDESLFAGDALGSVRGTSEYLEPGLHEEVVIELDDPVADPRTLVAMPHRDSNDNETYDFVDEEGGADGPYVYDGGAVVDDGHVTVSATATIGDQESDGETVVVDEVTLHEGGFVTIHDGSLLDGDALGSVRGTSEYLGPGTHTDVEITLDDPYEDDGTLIAMPHMDTNGNQAYDFVDEEGGADGPYVHDGGAVVDDAELTVSQDEMDGNESDDGDEMDGEDDTSDENESDDGMDGEDSSDGGDGMDGGDGESEQEMTGDDGSDGTPGFGVAAALVALLGAALLARRRP